MIPQTNHKRRDIKNHKLLLLPT